ncbi:hypothetical protein Goari_008718 [Gossypium aridum]|uniref:Gag1-like clamp domain-containing protein n=1 Tax=Gossypium aridum TaxID=34290 RepID=A0A7J8XVK4_GOSAI|nr:hypothetical protein [Gossypium aridum]
MDNSAVQSQGSISSISTSHQTLDPNGNAASANGPSEFVNHGKFSVLKFLWLVVRKLRVTLVGVGLIYLTSGYCLSGIWIVRFRPLLALNKIMLRFSNLLLLLDAGLILWNQTRQRWVGNKKSENQPQQALEPKLNWNATYESLLGSNKLFPQPIPLSEMIDFLVDVWEQEGLYD